VNAKTQKLQRACNWKHDTFHHKIKKHTFQEKKGCCAESDTLEASRSVTLTCGAT
jgi:hypothetical protein